MSDPVIEKARRFAESHFAGDGSGHDWWHVHRVWQMAKHLAEVEGADRRIVEIAALLHDVADWKLTNGDESHGLNTIRDLLKDDLSEEEVERICEIISRVSFKGAGVDTPACSLEGQVVQDADRLDALGAVGIARTFAYGGNRGRLIHHPGIPPEKHDSFEAYKKNNGPSTNHFYEKLLLLKDRMNTGTAKKIAEERHLFMEQYLDRFFREWDGHL
ncbi:MAG: HD domain-containing protein [Nitrospinaceae bacterium]|nr:HD domain-containing protein [Nitrospinaceae bacterium]NIR55138.1 HD domain-containing protein [Nitrospinaceae bacterium]NIS85558.1 HD domain-containing protein [Nitrospinaceae bacterium]NIT82392.1 HD domain-containing protein [Nitrospinaceae bacterium]NIU44605.1 HD domain-containing protein [Nitrospinaceae bacterium]